MKQQTCNVQSRHLVGHVSSQGTAQQQNQQEVGWVDPADPGQDHPEPVVIDIIVSKISIHVLGDHRRYFTISTALGFIEISRTNYTHLIKTK